MLFASYERLGCLFRGREKLLARGLELPQRVSARSISESGESRAYTKIVAAIIITGLLIPITLLSHNVLLDRPGNGFLS